MARRSKKPAKGERRRHQQLRAAQVETAVVQDTVTTLVCSVGTASRLIEQCLERLDEIQFDQRFARLARDIWRGRAGAAELASAVDDLLAEEDRHANTMGRLALRLKAIGDEAHQHLPPDTVDIGEVRAALFSSDEESVEDSQQVATLDAATHDTLCETTV